MMGGPDAMHGRFGGPGWMRGGDSAVGSDQRLAELKTTLGITPEQESAWSAYTEALKGKAEVIASHRQVMHGPTPVSADQRLNFHQQGLEQMQRLNTATRNLYAVLSPEQKARAGGLVSTPCVAR
jgi:hypothetical protein